MDGNWKSTVDRLRAVQGGGGKGEFATHVAGLFEEGHPQAAVSALLDLVFDDQIPRSVLDRIAPKSETPTEEPPAPPVVVVDDSKDSAPDVKVDEKIVVPGVVEPAEDEEIVVPGDDDSVP